MDEEKIEPGAGYSSQVTRIPSLNAIEGAGDTASAFADYGVVRIALGALSFYMKMKL